MPEFYISIAVVGMIVMVVVGLFVNRTNIIENFNYGFLSFIM